MNGIEYFWYVESDLPEGIGFDLFGRSHILTLCIVVAVVAGAAFLYRRKKRTFFIRCIAFFLPVLETVKILYLIGTGHMNIGYLPLHLCSLSIGLYPLFTVLKPGIMKECIGDFCCIVLLPAGLSALLFPDWTMYPIISFMSLTSFLWHTLQIMFPICLLCSQEARPLMKNIWRSLLLFLLFSIPIGIIDRITTCNYWFLLRPIRGTPLETIYQSAGPRGYLPILGLTAAAVVFITQSVISLIRFCFSPARKRE